MEIRSLESIKHKYFEIGKKEGKIKLADVEKDCSHLKLDENEIDELYSFLLIIISLSMNIKKQKYLKAKIFSMKIVMKI